MEDELGVQDIYPNKKDCYSIFSLITIQSNGIKFYEGVEVGKKRQKRRVLVRIAKLSNVNKLLMKRELAMHSFLQNQNGIPSPPKQLLKVFVSFEANNSNKVWSIMESTQSGGTINSVYKTLCIRPDEESIAYIMREVLYVLKYYHSLQCIYGDMRGENIWVNANGQIKVMISGKSINLNNSTDSVESQEIYENSIHWAAPEVVSQNGNKESTSTDIWSLGITAIELALGNCPYSQIKEVSVLAKVIQGLDAPRLESSCFSEKFKDFLKCCLQKDPLKRLSSTALLQHPFITQHMSETAVNNLSRDSFESKEDSLVDVLKEIHDNDLKRMNNTAETFIKGFSDDGDDVLKYKDQDLSYVARNSPTRSNVPIECNRSGDKRSSECPILFHRIVTRKCQILDMVYHLQELKQQSRAYSHSGRYTPRAANKRNHSVYLTSSVSMNNLQDSANLQNTSGDAFRHISSPSYWRIHRNSFDLPSDDSQATLVASVDSGSEDELMVDPNQSYISGRYNDDTIGMRRVRPFSTIPLTKVDSNLDTAQSPNLFVKNNLDALSQFSEIGNNNDNCLLDTSTLSTDTVIFKEQMHDSGISLSDLIANQQDSGARTPISPMIREFNENVKKNRNNHNSPGKGSVFGNDDKFNKDGLSHTPQNMLDHGMTYVGQAFEKDMSYQDMTYLQNVDRADSNSDIRISGAVAHDPSFLQSRSGSISDKEISRKQGKSPSAFPVETLRIPSIGEDTFFIGDVNSPNKSKSGTPLRITPRRRKSSRDSLVDTGASSDGIPENSIEHLLFPLRERYIINRASKSSASHFNKHRTYRSANNSNGDTGDSYGSSSFKKLHKKLLPFQSVLDVLNKNHKIEKNRKKKSFLKHREKSNANLFPHELSTLFDELIRPTLRDFTLFSTNLEPVNSGINKPSKRKDSKASSKKKHSKRRKDINTNADTNANATSRSKNNTKNQHRTSKGLAAEEVFSFEDVGLEISNQDFYAALKKGSLSDLSPFARNSIDGYGKEEDSNCKVLAKEKEGDKNVEVLEEQEIVGKGDASENTSGKIQNENSNKVSPLGLPLSQMGLPDSSNTLKILNIALNNLSLKYEIRPSEKEEGGEGPSRETNSLLGDLSVSEVSPAPNAGDNSSSQDGMRRFELNGRDSKVLKDLIMVLVVTLTALDVYSDGELTQELLKSLLKNSLEKLLG